MVRRLWRAGLRAGTTGNNRSNRLCVGYENPLDPAENCYVEDLMRAAIDALEMQSTEGALI